MKYAYYVKKFWPVYILTAFLCLAATAGADHAISTIAENLPVGRSHCIVIDAGHGGEDGGATSCTGVLESQLNLQIALRLNDICNLLGFQTKMIRTDDISVYTEGKTLGAKKVSDLRNRVRIVNDTENGILISIHQNTFPIAKYHGAQVFYNSCDSSKQLAERIQSMFAQTVNHDSNRKCKRADGIYLMEKVQKPGVLIECGFLSNPNEEALLRETAYQQKLSCAIASAISSYLYA